MWDGLAVRLREARIERPQGKKYLGIPIHDKALRTMPSTCGKLDPKAPLGSKEMLGRPVTVGSSSVSTGLT